jgi:hypothetical protein
MTALANILVDQAFFARNSGATVTLDRRYPTVSIEAEGCETIFMEGDDAAQFGAEVDKYAGQCPNLDGGTIELACARPYIESHWA